VSYQYPDRISIEGVTECDVTPKYAVLEIVIEGESTVFGNEAFNKSKEVSHLISELDKIGYSKENIILDSISIQTGTGKILKSSSARFNLLLNEISMDLIPQMLGLVSSQKNIEITEMNYEFGSLETERKQLLKDGCIKAKEQAQDICNSLGVSLLGVYSMSQKWSNPFVDGISQNFSGGGLRMSKSRSVQSQELEGLDFTTNYKSKLFLTLKFDFRVGEINAQ
jgi:uncharacterized protein YggE